VRAARWTSEDEEALVPRLAAEVRRATVDDLDDVLELWAQARAEQLQAGRQVWPGDEQLRPRLAEALADGSAEVLLAGWEGRPAGFVLLRIAPLSLLADAPAVHLEQLYVVPRLRRHGIARALLGRVVVRADRTGAEQVVCSVLPWARDTHRFFARLGFTPLVVRRGVATSVLRRRLSGESPRKGLDDLLLRRRSLRARADCSPEARLDHGPDRRLDEGLDGADALLG
jgi:GNAT superfamily N-acetyltransferase